MDNSIEEEKENIIEIAAINIIASSLPEARKLQGHNLCQNYE